MVDCLWIPMGGEGSQIVSQNPLALPLAINLII